MQQQTPHESMTLSPPVLLALGVGAVSAALALRLLFANSNSTRRRIHSLSGWLPLLGDVLEYARNGHRIHDWMVEKSLLFHGDPWRIHVPLPGLKSVVVVTSPDLIEEIMTTQFDNFPCGEYQITVLEDLMGRSIVTSDGAKWRHQRKAAVQFFTARALRACMATCMRDNMRQVYSVLDASISTPSRTTTSSSLERKPVDLLALFHSFALQTFVQIGLGVDLQLIGKSDTVHAMEHAIEDVTPVIVRRMQLPTFVWKLERWLQLEPERTVTTAMRGVREWLRSVIEESLEKATAKQSQKKSTVTQEDNEIKNVMELFVEQSTEDKDGLRADDLVDFMLTIVLGARSTSALALTWIFLMLAKHPHVEQKLRREMAKNVPEMAKIVPEAMYLTMEHVGKVVYLEAVIKEVLRLYPAFPIYQKEAACDTLVGGDLLIKKGELVAIAAYAMARLPTVWGEDAAEFKPERWICEQTGELLAVTSSKFTAFGSGPRICIGMKLAMLDDDDEVY